MSENVPSTESKKDDRQSEILNEMESTEAPPNPGLNEEKLGEGEEDPMPKIALETSKNVVFCFRLRIRDKMLVQVKYWLFQISCGSVSSWFT